MKTPFERYEEIVEEQKRNKKWGFYDMEALTEEEKKTLPESVVDRFTENRCKIRSLHSKVGGMLDLEKRRLELFFKFHKKFIDLIVQDERLDKTVFYEWDVEHFLNVYTPEQKEAYLEMIHWYVISNLEQAGNLMHDIFFTKPFEVEDKIKVEK